MSQDQFFESLEMSNKSLKTALACLAPEEGGSEGARYKTLLYFTYKYFNKTKYFRLRLSDEFVTERHETDLRLT